MVLRIISPSGGLPEHETHNPQLNQAPTENLSIPQQLEALKQEIEQTQDEQRRRDLFRAIKRLENFSSLQEGRLSDENLAIMSKLLLKGKTSDTYTSLDLLSLDRHGIEIANLVLSDAKNPQKELSKNSFQKNDEFIVNFGKNPHLAKRIGAGDILPPTIREIEINGKKATRGNNPRPGYYDAQGVYQPIYDGYTIKIISFGKATSEDQEAIDKRYQSEGVEETLEHGKGQALTTYGQDGQKFFNHSKSLGSNVEVREVNENYKTAYQFFRQKGLSRAQSLGIIANLHAESHLNPKSRGDGGRAHGIAQWHPDRRQKIEQGTGINISSASFEKQLEGLWWEITKGGEQETGNRIQKATSLEEAAKIFCIHFERPSNKYAKAEERAIMAQKLSRQITETV